MTHRSWITAFVCLALFARPVAADPLPVGNPSLQEILDVLVVSGPPLNAAAPAPIHLWDNTSSQMTAQVVADYSGDLDVTFGMYPSGDSANRPGLLTDGLTPIAGSTVFFLADNSIAFGGPLNGTAPNFGGQFGFFVELPTGVSFTEDELNAGGAPRAKVFQGNGSTMLQFDPLAAGLFVPNQFLIAFELGDDGGFNDFVVSVSAITPILPLPEPGSTWLIGASLAALLARRARSI